jgi:formyl-CoA transferase/CoA:oxalate CoA-transferase
VVPYGLYQASDGAILIACLTQSFWANLARAIGAPELADDPNFLTMDDRRRNRKDVDAIVARAIAAKRVAEWEAILNEYDVPHAPLLGITAALTHPHAKAREMLTTVTHPTLGAIPMVGRPIKFPDAPQEPLESPPVLGQHTADVLAAELGYTSETIAALRKSGAIGPQ